MKDNLDITNISEKQLVERCIANERQYQEILYRKYADQMYSVCLSYNKDEDVACDILQDSFIKVFRKLEQFNFESSLKGWIRRIIINTALDQYRKQKRHEEKLESYTQVVVSATIGNVLDQIDAQDLIALVNELPSRAALVLKLYAVEGYNHKEIAEKLAISEGTSKSQLHRARALLKQLLSKNNER
ncbi:MAG: RNA polymerase subunit sigma-24 [uncultured Aureispira sp.]|uniref:RNA polymerase subunit sigma-24 n=1 Tax=uncultured Aureispira sp. TaxID=1331704 RepID=A0A6S6U6W4_9BACT|nr:MAG: RNA polymerase subunit sigma-24 [uncultured Aureispira sp.]